ncbi:MAG: hypothetical protein PHP05_02485 [Sideroxydans sp.]|nr:hypothetical protein [Sideroxydans sp.]
MDFDLRLKAISRLAISETDAAKDALEKVLKKAVISLHEDTEYDLLEQSLSVLEAIAHRFSNVVATEIIEFIAAIKTRQITYDNKHAAFVAEIAKYQNASTLAIRAIEVLLRVRYFETQTVTKALLKLSIDNNGDILNEAINSLRKVAAYDLEVFYGNDRQGGIGGQPQKQMLDVVSDLRDDELVQYQRAVLQIAKNLLSPTIEGTRWSSTAVTISHGPAPAAGGVVEIRSGTIQLLKRLYALLQEIPQKLSVISVLSSATQPYHYPTGGENIATVIAGNTQEVLAFYKSLAPSADLPVVQKIESLSYWVYYHAPNDQVKHDALAIEQTIAANAEYQIYKTLIGFEGIFMNWEDLRRNDSYWEDTDKFRREKATEFANSINDDNFSTWRARILSYAKTESYDLATFPNFYYFLETFATAQPKLALKLLSEDAKEIAGFLIPLLRGLWAGPEQSTLREILNAWIAAGQYLYASTKQFLDCPSLDRTLVKRMLDRAAELNDLNTVALVMSVAVTNYRDDDSIISDLFLPALEILTERKSPQWIFDMWFRREARSFISKLDDQGVELILRNMMLLEKIDHQAEELLYLIALRMPRKVLAFLCKRLAVDKSGEKRKTYDAIPYRLHKLDKPLATIPREAVRIVREQYDGDYGMFIFRGGHLLETIFPQFSPEFENELLNLVDEGGDGNIEFVLAVLRNYEGQTFIHNVCKAIVKKVPADSEYCTEVTIALQNTGVVSGAYGFAEAYDRKKMEMQAWLSDSSDKVKEFAARYIEGLDAMSIADRKRADEEIALRKLRYDD